MPASENQSIDVAKIIQKILTVTDFLNSMNIQSNLKISHGHNVLIDNHSLSTHSNFHFIQRLSPLLNHRCFILSSISFEKKNPI